ncbi:hypothetical protein EUGRSUZ_A00949 [Eucalyptus grandis]|uniref:Uncharacterized protein n=2 Tax=Eucalyptus grandis TaxID=71139 RepID=A0A059DDN1_EUCGR|nr:hypothetical protein EUGRSUZ_A00949 [Eucalyptus grandis]
MNNGGGGDADEDETLGLLPDACKVVEYLVPAMSRDLLHKFPDGSSLGFDYSQSSIWSPLLPRSHFPVDSGCFATPRKLCFGFGPERTTTARRTKKRKKKINLSVSSKKKKRPVKVSDSSITPSNVACAPFARKGWDKVLKAATKHFKKKKRDPTAHVKLSNYLKD